MDKKTVQIESRIFYFQGPEDFTFNANRCYSFEMFNLGESNILKDGFLFLPAELAGALPRDIFDSISFPRVNEYERRDILTFSFDDAVPGGLCMIRADFGFKPNR